MSDRRNWILGIWDGHDSGCALFSGARLIFAANEERYTQRKLEVRFPQRSIQAACEYSGISVRDINVVTYSTTDLAKTLTRAYPRLKESYYRRRRQNIGRGVFHDEARYLRYRLLRRAPSALTRYISDKIIRVELERTGLRDYELKVVRHHCAHAWAASSTASFDDGCVVVMDGIGDGISCSIWKMQKGRLTLIEESGADSSLGFFFEAVTNLLNFRELEDEGKVMALASYASGLRSAFNPMLELFDVGSGLHKFRFSLRETERRLKGLLRSTDAWTFCAFAQLTLETLAMNFVSRAISLTGATRVALCGGVFSNVKLNMAISDRGDVDEIYVFPHMGDGGLAFGAAAAEIRGKIELPHLYWGSELGTAEIPQACTIEQSMNCPERIAQLLSVGEIVVWADGRMELGPRALGARSIVALPNSLAIRDRLNNLVKKRERYQPFCPSILRSDADRVFDIRGDISEQFMTQAYRVTSFGKEALCGAVAHDDTARPHIVEDSEPGNFSSLLREVKRITGVGAILNTSLNFHGQPLPATAQEVLDIFLRMNLRYLFLEGTLLRRS